MTVFRAWFRCGEGSFGFIICDWWCHLKAPWHFYCYSDLYSPEPGTLVYRGWRFRFRKIKRFH